MGKNYPLQIIVLLTVITGLVLLSFYGKIDPANHRFLTTGWEYSWDDDNPQEPAVRQWSPLPNLGQPEGYSGQGYLWLRVPIPQGTVKTPTLFTEFVHQSLEVYVGGARVYQYGLLPAPAGEKLHLWLPYHIIPLPDDAPGKMAYFRISSSASSIGIFGGVEYGPMWGMYRYKNIIELLKFSALALSIAAGLWSLIVYLYYRREPVYLAFVANALCGASIVFGTTYNSFLLYPHPDFWNNWIIVTGLSWKIVWLQFLVYVVETSYRRTVQRLVWLTAGFSCVQMVAAILNPLWMLAVLAFNVIYSIGCYAAVWYFCRHQLRCSREVQLYAGGISVWMAASTVDTLKIAGVIPANLLITWIGQIAETASLGTILILRYVAVHNQLREYAQELGFLNHNLENIVKDRTEELSVQNACLEQLFHNAPNAMVMLDIQYRIIKVNPVFETMFGYSADEAEGREFISLLCKAGEVPAECVDLHKKSVYVDAVRYHKDGSGIAVALTAYSFVTEHNQIGIYVVYRDISQRVLSERMLRESEEKYRLLAENMGDVIWLINFDRHLLYISPSFERLLGFKPREASQEYITPRLQAAIDELVNAYRQDACRRMPVLLEEERRSKDGSIVWIESSLSIAHDESGGVLGVLGITRNITARKRTEKLLFHAYERKRRNQFFQDILTGVLPSEQEIYARARYMRIYLPENFALCFCYVHAGSDIKPEQQDMLLDEVADLLNYQDGIEAWNAADGIGFICNLDLIPGGRQSERDVVEVWLKKLAVHFPQLRFIIGLAEYADSLAEFGSRFRHARIAARIGSQRYEENSIQSYEACGIYEVFDTFAGTKEAIGFVERTLGPLMEYDRQNGTELMDTLTNILSGNSLKEIAEQMFIHYKTLALRKQRIEKVLLVSLDSFEDRMMLGAALSINKMLTVRRKSE